MKKPTFLITILLSLFILYAFIPKEDKTPKNITLIKVYKKKRILEVYEKDVLFKTYKIALGKQPVGHKHFEGDNKTPEGVYFINGKNQYSAYHKNLGISYPNKKDVAYAKKKGKSAGGLIKIHGLPNGRGKIGKLHLLNDWTAGCIALTDKEIDEIYAATKVGVKIILYK
jgi:murein L,D-transpeptidase YafK|tara:strand:+ start:2142 stop:2651 length:510 start_codon:yes stop_codon:yes gene_type:complete